MMRKGLGAVVFGLWAVSSQAGDHPVTVAALGDSLTAGYGLPAGDGFVPQLQAWLDNAGVAAVLINAGVSGDTTRGGLARTDWTLTDDIKAMIVSLGGNDLLRGLPPESSRANLEGILQKAQQKGVRVLLVGLTAPGNYGAAYKQTFDAIYPELAAKYGALYAPNFFAGLQSQPDQTAARVEFMQSDGIHPNKAGVALIVDVLGPKVAELVHAAQP